jgi:uncharacterized protein YjbI with pentapeptide repeats
MKKTKMLRYATLRYATLRYATLRYATLRYATLRYAPRFHGKNPQKKSKKFLQSELEEL